MALKVKPFVQVEILGVQVDRLRMGEAVGKIEEIIKKGKRARVVTVNPEMVLAAQEDEEVKEAINGVDLATADGVGILAAAKYLQLVKSNIKNQISNIQSKNENAESRKRGEVIFRAERSEVEKPSRGTETRFSTSSNNKMVELIRRVFLGFRVGGAVVFDRKYLDIIPEQVAGDKLFAILVERASVRGWRVFFLGGRPGVAEEAGRKLEKKYPGLKWRADAGAENIMRELGMRNNEFGGQNSELRIKNPESRENVKETEFRSQELGEGKTSRHCEEEPRWPSGRRCGNPVGSEDYDSRNNLTLTLSYKEREQGARRTRTNATMVMKRRDVVIDKINKFRPQLLFVAYGVPQEEIWLARNWEKLEVNVGVGIGGTLDEVAGRVSPTPEVLRQAGLRWLWRLVRQPKKRWRRIWRAVVVFPWRVFRS